MIIELSVRSKRVKAFLINCFNLLEINNFSCITVFQIGTLVAKKVVSPAVTTDELVASAWV